MISIIICSRASQLSDLFFNNITTTIGSEHELIIIDNSENKYSIFEAYNEGIKKSNGDYYCFIHDDIVFHTQDWGKVIGQIFEQDDKIGLIGVAGTKVKTKMPSAWWDCSEEFKIINIIQHLHSGKIEHWQKGWSSNNIEEVVAIDGVFMAARKDEKIRFSSFLSGFHNYDLNLSFEYLKNKYKVVVSNEIVVEHFSIGSINSSWFLSAIKLHTIYNKVLPLMTSSLDNFNLREAEFNNGSKFLFEGSGSIPKIVFLKIWIKLILLKPKSKFHFRFLKILLQ